MKKSFLSPGTTTPDNINLKRCAGELIIYPFDHLKKYDLSILVGGQISILCDIGEFLQENLPDECGIAASRHPLRDCLYEEAQAILEYKKDKPQVVDRQVEKYRNEGMPEHEGLIETGVIIRRHKDHDVIRHCRLWLDEYREYSQRDQLSFPYILWKYKLVKLHYFSTSFRDKGFMVHSHNFEQTF